MPLGHLIFQGDFVGGRELTVPSKYLFGKDLACAVTDALGRVPHVDAPPQPCGGTPLRRAQPAFTHSLMATRTRKTAKARWSVALATTSASRAPA